MPKGWQPFLEVLVQGSRGNFDGEPRRFLTACALNIGAGFGKRDLLEFGEVLTVLARKGSKHLRIPVLKMALVLISQPDKYFASELLMKFFPIMECDFDTDFESKELVDRVTQVLSQSNAYRLLQGKTMAEKAPLDAFFDRVIAEAGSDKIKSALSSITQTAAKVEDYAIGRETDASSWNGLLSVGDPMRTLSEKLARSNISNGREPKHKKRAKEENELIETDFLNSFMSEVKPQAIAATFLSHLTKTPKKKGLGEFFLNSSSAKKEKSVRTRKAVKVGSKVRRKKKPVTAAAASNGGGGRGPPPPPPLSVLRATTTTPAVTRALFKEDKGYPSDSDSYYYSTSEDEYTGSDYSDTDSTTKSEYSDTYSSYSSESESAGSYTSDSDRYDNSSSYSTSTEGGMSYSSAD